MATAFGMAVGQHEGNAAATATPSPWSLSAPREFFREKRVGVLDDQKETRAGLMTKLIDAGVDAERYSGFGDPKDAIESLLASAISGRPMDIIYVDLYLGHGKPTGITFLKELKKKFERAGILDKMPAVVVHTGSKMSRGVASVHDGEEVIPTVLKRGRFDEYSDRLIEAGKRASKLRMDRPEEFFRRIDAMDEDVINEGILGEIEWLIVEKLKNAARAARRHIESLRPLGLEETGWWLKNGKGLTKLTDELEALDCADIDVKAAKDGGGSRSSESVIQQLHDWKNRVNDILPPAKSSFKDKQAIGESQIIDDWYREVEGIGRQMDAAFSDSYVKPTEGLDVKA
jgi:hypothetical protein